MITRSCPCSYVTPCQDMCSCAMPTYSAGCRRCCTYGSEEQRRTAALRLARLIDTDTDDDAVPNGFIPLDGGRLFVRQFEIIGLRWVREDHDHGHDRTPRWTTTWHLQLSVDGVGPIHVYGDDIARVMRALGLPTEHPSGGY